MGSYRREKVAELIKREISVILDQEVKDVEIRQVTVIEVEPAPDLKSAKVFVSVRGDAEERRRVLSALDRAQGYLRSELGARVSLRYTPKLRFLLDDSLDRAMRIEDLLKQIHQKKEKP